MIAGAPAAVLALEDGSQRLRMTEQKDGQFLVPDDFVE